MNNKTLREKIEALGSNEEYMSDAQYKIFETFLREELNYLQSLQSENVDQHAVINERSSDPSDEGTKNESQESAFREAERIKVRIAQNIQALKAIRNEEFGFCASCGGDVGLQRLLAVPHALRDADCSTIHEMKQKQMGRTASSRTIL
jgi:DnaK suppressor protein